MAFTIRAKIEGVDELVKQLRDELPKRMQGKILRKAIADGSKLVLKTAKQKVPVGETGMLKRSLGRRVKVYRNSGKVLGIVGPRTGFKKTKAGRTRTALGEKFQQAHVNPTKYAHLVELGTRHSAPKPFLRPALDNNKEAVKAIFAKTIKDGLEHNRIGSVEPDGVKGD